MEEFVQVRRGDLAWEPIFERDGVKQALLSTSESLVDELKDAGWAAVYSDEHYVILRPMKKEGP
jgi:hypothetical protein